MSHALLARSSRGTDRAAVPMSPVGPAWFGTVMGTGILATLLAGRPTLPGAVEFSRLLLVVDWLLLAVLTVGYGRRISNDASVIRHDLRDPVAQVHWGMVSMGILSAGSATLAVLPAMSPALSGLATRIDIVMWLVGTVLGLVTTFAFTVTVVRGRAGEPTYTWGLPVVPPMVSATAGAALLPHASGVVAVALLVVCCACFVLALSIGGVIFVLAYLRHLGSAPLPIPASTSAWIPLGVVGQSSAAAQAVANHAAPLLTNESAAHLQPVANAYGVAMLTMGIPLVAYAIRATIRGFRAGMPFSPGWWALTFPIGTLALGAHLLGAQPGLAPYATAGLMATLTLMATWLLCALASLRAVAVQVTRSRVSRAGAYAEFYD